MFTARVPGHGLVEWTAEQVDDHAEQLRRTHLPESSSNPLRRWRRSPQECAYCGEPWPCPPAWWADRYDRSLARRITTAADEARRP